MIDTMKLSIVIARQGERRFDDEDDFYYERASVVMDGIEIAYASIVVGGSEPAYVERIDVDEAYRGKGVGTWTLRELAKHYDDIIIAADNADANRLYQRLGHEYTGESAGYVDQGYGVHLIR